MTIRRLRKISDHDKRAILEALRGLLCDHDEVTFALLYGSMATPLVPGRYGDIDLAIYVKPDQPKAKELIWDSRIEAEAYRYLSSLWLNFPPIEVLDDLRLFIETGNSLKTIDLFLSEIDQPVP